MKLVPLVKAFFMYMINAIAIFDNIFLLLIQISCVYAQRIPDSYDALCDTPERLLIPVASHWGEYSFLERIVNRVRAKRNSATILLLGGSITANGQYFRRFIQNIGDKYNVNLINRAQGATNVEYALYCIKIDDVQPDIVFLEYKVNVGEYYEPSQLEALIRKILRLPSHPIVVILNFKSLGSPTSNDILNFNSKECAQNSWGLSYAMHYGLPLLDLCRHLTHCFGKKELIHLYARDGLHPHTGTKGYLIPSSVLTTWWNTTFDLIPVPSNTTLLTNSHRATWHLPRKLFQKKVSDEFHCECLNDDSYIKLVPLHTDGFRDVSRKKKRGWDGGFNSVKRCWEGNDVGNSITFRFYGRNLKVAVYKNSSGMGVADVFLDSDVVPSRNISGYFCGVECNRWKGIKGKQQILPLYDSLQEGWHNVTFRIAATPSNPAAPGHNFQIIALLYSSNIHSTASNIQKVDVT